MEIEGPSLAPLHSRFRFFQLSPVFHIPKKRVFQNQCHYDSVRLHHRAPAFRPPSASRSLIDMAPDIRWEVRAGESFIHSSKSHWEVPVPPVPRQPSFDGARGLRGVYGFADCTDKSLIAEDWKISSLCIIWYNTD